MTRFPYKPVGSPLDESFRNDINKGLKDIEEDIKELGAGAIEAVEAAGEANTQALYAQDRGDFADEKGLYAEEQGDFALAQGTIAAQKATEADTAKQTALDAAASARTNGVNPVDNFAAIATTYPNPENGDEVQTLDDGKVYRRQNGNWEFVYELTPGPVANLTQQLADMGDEVTSLETNKADKTTLTTTTNEVTALKTKVDGIDRGWGGTYASLSALQAAIPAGDNKRYVTSDNGHWYFWNGTVWTDGGVFQAAALDEAQLYNAMRLPSFEPSVSMTNKMTNGNFAEGSANWTASNATLTVSNGEAVMLASATSGRIYNFAAGGTVVGRKYFVKAKVKATSPLVQLQFGATVKTHSGSGAYEDLYLIATATSTGHAISIYDTRSSGWDNVTIDNVVTVDVTDILAAYPSLTAASIYNAIAQLTDAYVDGTKSVPLKGMYNGKIVSSINGQVGLYNVSDFPFADGSFDGKALKKGSVAPSKLASFVQGKNLFNKEAVTNGRYIGPTTGSLGTNADYSASDFIEILPNTTYTLKYPQFSAFYDANKVFISGFNDTAPGTFTSPANAAFFRTSATTAQLDTQQLELGTISTTFEPYRYELKYLTVKNIVLPTSQRDRLYSFKDAWIAWENGSKFPVGIMGDSTGEGTSTSTYVDANRHEVQDTNAGGWGMVDYICTTAYPYLLEQLIKKETGKTEPRIYNMSYSGRSFYSLKSRLNDILSHAYSDVKMVGLALGINDRVLFTNTKDYEAHLTSHLEYFINTIYAKGIQPFIITSQATIEPYPAEEYVAASPLRTSENINSVANRVKREMAKKYNLEIIELTDFGEHLLTHSAYPLGQIIDTDDLHFVDKGHELEAGYLFSQFSPRTIVVKDTEKLGFLSQRIKSKVPSNLINYLSPFEDGFKIKANYTKSDSNDLLIQDFYVLNYSKKPLTLKAFVTQAGAQYVKLNDANVNVTANGQTIGTLDIGLHHIQAFTGASTAVDFKGFTLS